MFNHIEYVYNNRIPSHNRRIRKVPNRYKKIPCYGATIKVNPETINISKSNELEDKIKSSNK